MTLMYTTLTQNPIRHTEVAYKFWRRWKL